MVGFVSSVLCGGGRGLGIAIVIVSGENGGKGRKSLFMQHGFTPSYQGIIQALILRFGLKTVTTYGPPYADSYDGIIRCILDLDAGGGTGGLNWAVTTANTTATAFGGYLANGSSKVTITLPSTASAEIGDRVGVYALNAVGFELSAPSGSQIRFGNQITGTGAWIRSTQIGDSLEVIYLGSGLWGVVSSIGNLLLETAAASSSMARWYTLGIMGSFPGP